jgi:hypothetical protein
VYLELALGFSGSQNCELLRVKTRARETASISSLLRSGGEIPETCVSTAESEEWTKKVEKMYKVGKVGGAQLAAQRCEAARSNYRPVLVTGEIFDKKDP